MHTNTNIHKAVDLPLHYGSAPRWLFRRMVDLSEVIIEYIIDEKGSKEVLKRLSNPDWFQALGCVLGFDWHSSGLTTTTTGALKEALKRINLRSNPRLWVAGGKGKTSLKTPDEIRMIINNENMNVDPEKLINASRLTAKIDNSCIQDGFELYHHTFFFDENGNFTVVQQGMNNKWARRYHWYNPNEWFNQQEDIVSDKSVDKVLNLVSKKSENVREISLDIVREYPEHHNILNNFLSNHEKKVLKDLYELQPEHYEELLMFKGFGPKKIRALALTSNIIFGSEIDWQDPVKYSFAHGGKDGTPFPVDKKLYDEDIEIIRNALKNKKRKYSFIDTALKRLSNFQ
ncbi:DUF763 domain-containing protein [Candidatus Micrarchaeota archaeon]|nr:DUF763 domain-containing protein [Candidatus Micrarchaeota archaeon]